MQICLREWSTIAATFTLTPATAYKLSTLTWKLKKKLFMQLSFPLNTLQKRYPNKGFILWNVTLLYESDLTAVSFLIKTVVWIITCILKWCMRIQILHQRPLSTWHTITKNFTLLTAGTLMYKKILSLIGDVHFLFNVQKYKPLLVQCLPCPT